MAADFMTSRRDHRGEARSKRVTALFGLDGHVNYHERVIFQPRVGSRVPPFVARTATTASRRGNLDELFRELWELNEDHVGERSREAEVAICHDEEFMLLRDRLIRWSTCFLNDYLMLAAANH